jgi:hypothetical protein
MMPGRGLEGLCSKKRLPLRVMHQELRSVVVPGRGFESLCIRSARRCELCIKTCESAVGRSRADWPRCGGKFVLIEQACQQLIITENSSIVAAR